MLYLKFESFIQIMKKRTKGFYSKRNYCLLLSYCVRLMTEFFLYKRIFFRFPFKVEIEVLKTFLIYYLCGLLLFLFGLPTLVMLCIIPFNQYPPKLVPLHQYSQPFPKQISNELPPRKSIPLPPYQHIEVSGITTTKKL